MFCEVAVKLLGLVQEYVAPGILPATRVSVWSVQIGVLLEVVGEAGIVFTVTVVVPLGLVQPKTV